jgi:hypothetical protein
LESAQSQLWWAVRNIGCSAAGNVSLELLGCCKKALGLHSRRLRNWNVLTGRLVTELKNSSARQHMNRMMRLAFHGRATFRVHSLRLCATSFSSFLLHGRHWTFFTNLWMPTLLSGAASVLKKRQTWTVTCCCIKQLANVDALCVHRRICPLWWLLDWAQTK